MAIYGKPGEEIGDQIVFGILSYLSKEWLVYAQPNFATDSGDRNPDYVVIHPDVGVIILEVKDWCRIIEHKQDEAKIERNNGEIVWETSPIKQARLAGQKLANRLSKDPLLINLRGKLDFPYRFAGILPHFSNQMLYGIRQRWGANQIFGFEDLTRDRIEQALRSIPAPFTKPMTPDQVNAVRAIVDPDNIIRETHGQDIRIKGILDRLQEELVKEPFEQKKVSDQAGNAQQLDLLENGPDAVARQNYLDSEVPDEVVEAQLKSHIRLIRGFAGTGKTDVLILRARYLINNYTDLEILVTTFNRPIFDSRLLPEIKLLHPRAEAILFYEICKEIYRAKYHTFQTPQSTEGVLSKLLNDGGEISEIIEQYGVEFLNSEIQWMKELGCTSEEKYLQAHRKGRGGREGKALNEQMRKRIFKVFLAYQTLLLDMPAMDYSDLYRKALEYLLADETLHKKYDAILVDEAQHFAPNWIGLLNLLLKPGGSLLLCDDPSQSVYRAFSWKEKGVDVSGRTRWLRIPYRCTKKIFEAAYALIDNNPIAKQLIAESGEQITPILTSQKLREGRKPEVHNFPTWVSEKEFIRDRIEGLIYEGYFPNEIAILHSKKFVLDEFSDLQSKGVIVDDLRRETGMEYKVVFLPKINDLFERDPGISLEEFNTRQQVTCYMAMTRARDHVFLLMEGKWPALLKPLDAKVDRIDHN